MAVENFRTVTIYGLVASNDAESIRYIGQTASPLHIRLKNHLFDAKRGRPSPVYQWVRSVLALGHEIKTVTIEKDAIPDISEQEAIEQLRPLGLLLNERGGGIHGKNSEATKSRMAEVMRNRWNDPEYRDRTCSSIQKSMSDKTVLERVRSGILKSKMQAGVIEKTSGEKNGSAKLTDLDVREMRSQFDSGVSTSEIGRRFSVSQAMAWLVVHRKNWVHVT